MLIAKMVAIMSESVSADPALVLCGGALENDAPATANTQKIEPRTFGPIMNFGSGQYISKTSNMPSSQGPRVIIRTVFQRLSSGQPQPRSSLPMANINADSETKRKQWVGVLLVPGRPC
jgi:hypothetical protein